MVADGLYRLREVLRAPEASGGTWLGGEGRGGLTGLRRAPESSDRGLAELKEGSGGLRRASGGSGGLQTPSVL